MKGRSLRLLLLLCGMLGLAFSVAMAAGERIRPAAVAGSWYPDEPRQLTGLLDRFLAQAPAPTEEGLVRALISPHAGYTFSGATAAVGFRQVQGHAYRRVVVLGPAHRGGFDGLSIADVTHYQTPLGRIPLDQGAVAQLRRSPLVTSDPAAHTSEHSIEMQLPFLQRVLPGGWQLVPILVGRMGADDYRRAAVLLRPLLDEQTLLVVSSDFTHYGPRYGYVPFPHDTKTPSRLKALDEGALDRILAKDADGFLDYVERTGITICGFGPIAILTHWLQSQPRIQGQLLRYATSGELTGDFETSVSYLSVVFREGPSPAEVESGEGFLSDADMRLLHRLASAAVSVAANPGDRKAKHRLETLLSQVPPSLQRPAGAFVTLNRQGQLRGCIGYIAPREPVYQAVVNNAISAARRDPRFVPLGPDELDGLELEVSVLSPARPVASYHDIALGRDGIILEKDGHSAVFLPEVPTEFGWDLEQTLDHLTRKAGLPPGAWREGASFKTFRTQTVTAPLE